MQLHRGHCTVLCPTWGCTVATAPARLRCRVEPYRTSVPPGARPGTATMLPDGNVPPKVPVPPHCHSSLGKVQHTSGTGNAWQGWGYPACHCQGTPQPLICVPPHASCQHSACAMGLCRVPRAVPCPTAVSGPGSPLRHIGSYLCPWEPRVLGRWLVARVGCGVGGPLGSGWTRAGLSCCSWRRAAGACLLLRQPCQARGGTCPHRALAKVRQRKVHGGSGPRVTQQCPVPRLARRRHSIPTGLLGPVVLHVGPLKQAAWLGLALHCTGPSVPLQGTSLAAVREPCTAYPSTHARWILFTPSAGTVSHAPLTLCWSVLPRILWSGWAGC